MLAMNLLIVASLLTTMGCSHVHPPRPQSRGKTKLYTWDVATRIMAPDNFEKSIIAINGQYPGPTIEVDVFDTIIVEIFNHLDHNFTIHWHGMLQQGTVKSDGAPYVTQSPIPPGGKYKYMFNVEDQAGTWWYHAHTGLDSEQCYGALIVKDDPNVYSDLVDFDNRFQYDDERVMMFSELWHRNLKELVQGLLSAPFQWVDPADSLVTNGKSYKVWGKDGKNNSTLPFNEGYEVISVRQNKRYRFRLIGGQGVSYITFRMAMHKFTIIEADGTYIEPIATDHIEISPGQRYSIIVETNQDPNNYFMCAQSAGDGKYCGTGVSILHYIDGPDPLRFRKDDTELEFIVPRLKEWEYKLHTHRWYKKGLVGHFYPVPARITKDIHLKVAEATDNQGKVFFTIQGKKFQPRNATLWDKMIDKTYTKGSESGVIDINEGDNVQIIIEQYTDKSDKVECMIHPWHLHGHSYYVVGSGSGRFDPHKDNLALNIKLQKERYLPILRDTFTHYPQINATQGKPLIDGVSAKVTLAQDSVYLGRQKHSILSKPDDYVPCGWYAIRFKANNPGSWFFHCHITPHLIMGKVLVLNELSR